MKARTSTAISATELERFADYCASFYDKYGDDPIYPIATRAEIDAAIPEYLELCDSDGDEWPTWGGGDSMDREGVRNIIESKWSDEPQFSEKDVREFFDRINHYIRRGEITHLTFEDFVREPTAMQSFRPDTYQKNDVWQAEAEERLAMVVASINQSDIEPNA
jgi:hypothetical protein